MLSDWTIDCGADEVIRCHSLSGVDTTAAMQRPMHLAVGIFDGLHLGHQAVFDSALQQAALTGGISALLTFDPHPTRVLNMDRPTRLMMPLQMRIREALRYGLTAVLVHPFTLAFAAKQAIEFPAYLKALLPRLQSLHMGENFRFGKGRSGNVEQLNSLAAELGVTVYASPRCELDGAPVSSSRIRSLLAAGEIVTVNRLLGRAYAIRGAIASGRQLGRQLGFPTLNIPFTFEAEPAYGVYAVELFRLNGEDRAARGQFGIANYGVRPSVDGGGTPVLEVHLKSPLELPGIGERVEVELQRFVRTELRFDSLAALREQIDRDVAAVFALC